MSGPAGAPVAGASGGESARALSEALGSDAVLQEPPLAVEGAEAPVLFRPGDGGALARGLALLSQRGAAVLPRGGGSRLGLGRPPERVDAVLSTASLVGVDELDAEDGVLLARAGTPLAELRTRVQEAGWELPLDAPGERATLGGAIAAAAAGPRETGWGPVKDAVLGLEVALATGERTRCGGRVVKNVTGFDLPRLYTGSLGTLGVVEGAWIRLRPRPAAVEHRAVRLPPGEDGRPPLAAALALARLGSARVAALASPAAARALSREERDAHEGRPDWWLLLELAGEPEAVERDGALVREAHAVVESGPGAVEALRRDAVRDTRPGRARLRAVALPAGLAALLEAAAATAGAGQAALHAVVHPALGVAELDLPCPPEGAARVVESVRAAARAGGGSAVVTGLAPEERRRVDVWGLPEATRRIMRSLKQRYDPARVLAPGRFGEGL